MTVQFAIAPASEDLSSSSVFRGDSAADKESGNLGVVLRYTEDCEIYGEGEDARYYYKVVSGVVRTCKFLSDGRRVVDAFHVAGDVFGIETDGAHALTAEAVNDCKIVAYRHPPFDRMGVMVPPQLLVHVLHSLGRAQEHAVLLGCRSAIEKVATFLLDWAQRSHAVGPIALAMSRDDIGDYLGLTIETVSRTLTQLERQGVIELPSVRQFRIKDLDALTELTT